jgi:hypothetical protein
MIDRVGSFSMPERLDRSERGSERRNVGSDFENLMRGLEQAGENPRQSASRSGQSSPRSREAGILNPAPDAAARAAAVSNRVAPTSANLEEAAEAASTPAAQNPATATRAAATSAAAGFVRTADTAAPHLPRFREVPESAKHPLGPYRQAPGGDWWLVNPFTGPEPWLALDAASNPTKAALETEAAPTEFVRVFGPRPDSGAVGTQWDLDLGFFKGTGIPEGFNEAQLEAAKAEFDAWGLGEPVFYEGRYGWQVRFPDSPLPTFETTASTALLTPHLVIAEHQVRSIQEGIEPGRYHPWLPERLHA